MKTIQAPTLDDAEDIAANDMYDIEDVYMVVAERPEVLTNKQRWFAEENL